MTHSQPYDLPEQMPAYRNPALPIEQRVADLLSRMTLEDKVAQVHRVIWEELDFLGENVALLDAEGNLASAGAARHLAHGASGFGRISFKRTPRAAADLTNALQKYLRQHTRLGIPALFNEEGLHGLMAHRATSFPQAIALASMWDPALVEQIFTAAALETRTRSSNYVFTPVFDVACDPRWGRTEETFGEDPYSAPANFSEHILREQLFPPFEAVVVEAIILLKNEGNLLPLDLRQIKTIAVIGPNAADLHLGGYSWDPGRGVTVLKGIRTKVGSAAEVRYAEGCRITEPPNDWRAWWEDDVIAPDPAADAARIAEAADVVLLVLGENEATCREGWSQDHLGDRDTLDLPGRQEELARAVVVTGKPVVALLINGRPLSVNYLAVHVPAILEGWYLGQEGGTAVADVLFGDVDPSGKLPITFPRSVV